MQEAAPDTTHLEVLQWDYRRHYHHSPAAGWSRWKLVAGEPFLLGV